MLRAPLRAAIGWELTTGQDPPSSRVIGCGRGATASHWLRAVSVTARPRSAAALAGPPAGTAPGAGLARLYRGSELLRACRRSAGLGPERDLLLSLAASWTRGLPLFS